jgi:hypothetical protein
MSDVSLEGKLIGKPEGVIKEEVSMKKISNRKIISVMEDMLKDESTLFLVCSPMLIFLVAAQ